MIRRMVMSLLVFLLATAVRSAVAAPKPNVLIILADDLGYSDLGCYGGEIATPNLDRLAANGLRFTQFYNTARCWPSRAALLTGYYAQQVNRDPAGLRPKWAALLPELLAGAGYRSYHAGKWHVDGKVRDGGFGRSYLVVDQDRFFTPCNHQLDDKALPQPASADGYYATVAIADHAVRWLSDHAAEHKQDPFFLYLAFTAPHFPIQALPEDIARYRERYRAGWDKLRAERWRRVQSLGLVSGALSDPEPTVAPSWNLSPVELRARVGPGEVARAVPWDTLTPEQQDFQAAKMAVHAAMVDRIDREVGRVLETLQRQGVYDDTLILFASDNGASAEQIIRGDGHDPSAPVGSAATFLGIGPGWSTAANTPFRRHKSWNHEGGISTPLIVHWPSGIAAKGALRHTQGHLVDIAPTLLELAGVNPPSAWNGEPRPVLPGHSLVPALAADVAIPHDALFFKHEGNRGLRVGDWKIVASGPQSPWELYHISVDRAEMHNLAREQPERVAELAQIWERKDAEYAREGATGRPLPKARKKQK